MTSDPAAPGAAAVYLFREETADDDRHMHTLYARIKILKQQGINQFSDITMPYETNADLVDGWLEQRRCGGDSWRCATTRKKPGSGSLMNCRVWFRTAFW
ncbi:MAG TPA: hypothetical protein VGF88_23125 [Acidobacteriaceae bacterium]|jgi:hypothetical protein